MLANTILLRNLIVFICAIFGSPSMALPPHPCDDAAQYAAAKTGVPVLILRAISLVETGRENIRSGESSAWPWAVHAHQKSHWFPDSKSALSFIENLVNGGMRNIDVGCFQLNINWHMKDFKNLEEMISPRKNAIYAANFLNSLYLQTGNWREAVGRYHSSDFGRAEVYLQRLEKIFSKYLSAAPAFGLQPIKVSSQPSHRPQRFRLVAANGPLLHFARPTQTIIGGSP